MNLSKLFPLVVAVLCITAIGVSATTLDSSLSTDPDEEIDTYEILPIGQDDAAEIEQQMEGSEDADDGSDGDDASSQSQEQSSASREEATGMSASPPSLLDRLLDFLLGILRFLLALGVLLALGALGYRYRDRIADAFWGLLQPTDDPADLQYERSSWPDGSPSNAVERAWLTLMETIDPERPEVMTPSECAAEARRAGLDAAPVETITTAFERVEYGGVPPSEEADRVEDALQQLDGGRGAVRTDGRGTDGGAD